MSRATIYIGKYSPYWKGTNDEFDNKKSHCVGIDWDRFPFGQYPGGRELDQ